MSTTHRQTPEAKGMNSTLKYKVLPLALVVVVVFGVTIISLGVGKPPTTEEGVVTYSPPLYFTLTEMAYDPTSEQMAKRTFPGYYEPTGGQHLPVSFWFSNPHPVPVKVAILGRSCTACSSARIAVVPPETIGAVTTRGALVGGLGAPESPTDLGPPTTDAIYSTLPWNSYNLDRHDESFEIPPGSADQPTWGVLQFGVSLAVVGPKPLSVNVGITAGDNAQVQMPFHMVLNGANPFDVTPNALQFGDLRQGASPVTKDLIYYSMTRGPTTNPPLPEPTLTPGASDPFLKIGKPIPLDSDQVESLAVQLSVQGKGGPIRVRGAYRVPVTLYRHLPGAPSPGSASEPDIGPYERQVGVSAAGVLHSVPVPVTATILGLVGLIDAEAADLKHFNAHASVEKAFTLASDRTDLELQPLPDQTRPKWLKVTVEPPRTESGRRFWTLKVGVPAEALVGTLPADSVAVLEARTPSGVRKVRIPVKGVAFAGARRQ